MSETEWKVENPDEKGSQVDIPEILPLLPIRDIVIYPYMMLPLFVGRDVSIRAVEEALSRDRLIFLVAQELPYWKADWTLPALQFIYLSMFFIVVVTMTSGIWYVIKNREVLGPERPLG